MTAGAMAGRTVLVTGASSGIGRAAAGAMASTGARLLMVCRDAGRGEAARRAVVERSGNAAVEVLLADLAQQAQVRAPAEQVQRRRPLHVLVNSRFWIDRREVACRFRDAALEEELHGLCASMCAA